MELNKNDLLKYTSMKKNVIPGAAKPMSHINYAPVTDANVGASISQISKINLVPIGGGADGDSLTVGGVEVDMFGNVSDADLVNLYGKPTTDSTIKFATTTYKNFSPYEISNIKRAIYELKVGKPDNRFHIGSTGSDSGNDDTNIYGGIYRRCRKYRCRR